MSATESGQWAVCLPVAVARREAPLTREEEFDRTEALLDELERLLLDEPPPTMPRPSTRGA